MQVSFIQQLTQASSTERPDAYRSRLPQQASELQLFARYAWNMALSENLYPSLQALEIALRNTIHYAASQHFNRSDWFNEPSALQHEHERVARAHCIA